MCGVIGLQLRGALAAASARGDGGDGGHLGALLTAMTSHLCERGPDSAGFAVYGDPELTPPGRSTVSVLSASTPPGADLLSRLRPALPDAAVLQRGQALLVSAAGDPARVLGAVRAALPGIVVTGHGRELAVLKGVGDPSALAGEFGLAKATGHQAVGHTRMATESAVTAAHCHPFAVAPDLAFVHNGSFANHATIRRQLVAEGVTFDSDNDSEVGARFLAWRLEHGDDLEKALRVLTETFDGFYTLVVSTADSLAIVRDRVACKPAMVAVTADYVAIASEYRALSELPGITGARMSEPAPEEVLVWSR